MLSQVESTLVALWRAAYGNETIEAQLAYFKNLDRDSILRIK